MDSFQTTFKRLNTAVIGLLIIFFGIEHLQNYVMNWPRFFIVLAVYGIYYVGVGTLINFYGRHPKFTDEGQEVTPFLMVQMFMLLLGFNFLGSLVVMILETILSQFGIELLTLNVQFVPGDWVYNILIMIEACLLAPIIEEIFFRGFLLNEARIHDNIIAIIFSSLCFALIHGNIAQAIPAFLSGCVLAYIDVKTNRLWPSIILHMCNNTLAMFVTNSYGLLAIVLMFILEIGAAVYTVYWLETKHNVIKGIFSQIKIKTVFSCFKNLPGVLAIIMLLAQFAYTIVIK